MSNERLGRLLEQEVRLVEEEHELGLGRIPDLGQLLEQLGQQPEQEGGVQLGCGHQPVGGQHVDDPLARQVGAHQLPDIERRLAEELLAALLLQGQQPALDGADRGRAHPAVLDRQLVRALADEAHERPQVLQVQQQQALVVGDLEGDREHAFLGVVQAEQTREQQRPHLRDGGPHRMALLPEQIPEHGRIAALPVVGEADLLHPLVDLGMRLAGLADAGEIAFDVGHEHRHAVLREALGQHLERDRLAGAGRAGDQAVAVGQSEIEQLWRISLADQHGVVRLPHRPPHRYGPHDRPLAQAWTVSAARTK